MRLPTDVQTICTRLSDGGHRAVVVGGCVRDMIMGRDPHDWDVATSALPEQVQNLFERTVPTGIKHGTVTALEGDSQIEVTTFRSEGVYSDSRHPDSVALGVTLEEDLSRRDFTMNAIAFEPSTGEFRDPFRGRDDIEKRLIRAVGHPVSRLTEDALRILRAWRFSSTLGFDLEFETRLAMRFCVPLLKKVSAERIRDEILKLLPGAKVTTALCDMQTSGAFQHVLLPELGGMVGVAQNRYHKYDVWMHTVYTVAAMPNDPILRLTALLHDVAKPVVRAPHPTKPGEYQFIGHEVTGAEMADVICQRLKLSNEDRQRVVRLILHHLAGLHLVGAGMPGYRRFVRKLGAELVPDLLALMTADTIGGGVKDPSEINPLREKFEQVLTEKPAMSTNQLPINGDDVMQLLGIEPGPQVGTVMRSLLESVTDNPELNNREKLLELLHEYKRRTQ